MRLELNPAQKAYADCVEAKRSEMLLYSSARQLREVLDHRERYAELARDPRMAAKYPGGVDQVIAEGFRRYREAGGQAPNPQAVQPGEPPCAPPIVVPPGRTGPSPAVLEAEREHEACVVRNRRAWDLAQSSERVEAARYRRDEMRKTGERLEWKLASRDNFDRAERELAVQFDRYRSLGGGARTAEEVVRAEDPCREARAKVNAAVREAYPGGPGLSRSVTIIPVPPK